MDENSPFSRNGNLSVMNKAATPQTSQFTPAQIRTLAERFCATELCDDTCADACVIDPDYPHPRYGTHLMTVSQAEVMFTEMLKEPL
jgi:hypothetical protein